MKTPTQANFGVLASAGELAREFGESFVVFVGGLAEYATFDAGAARHEARERAKRHGRDHVTIKRIRV